MIAQKSVSNLARKWSSKMIVLQKFFEQKTVFGAENDRFVHCCFILLFQMRFSVEKRSKTVPTERSESGCRILVKKTKWSLKNVQKRCRPSEASLELSSGEKHEMIAENDLFQKCLLFNSQKWSKNDVSQKWSFSKKSCQKTLKWSIILVKSNCTSKSLACPAEGLP